MGQRTHPASLSRRALFKAVGVITAVSLAPNLLVTAEKAQAATLSIGPSRVGLILPESEVGSRFHQGLQLALPGQAVAVEQVPVGRVGAAEGAGRLLAGGYDRLVGLMGPDVASGLTAQLSEAGATLLAVDTGANLIRTAEESSQVVTHSLGLWRAALALGAWSARHYGPRSLVLSGIHESGYDMLHAFEIGVTQAGGSPLPALVTHHPTAPVDWSVVLDQVQAAGPDLVYALYSGTAAVEFLRAWRERGLPIPLVASAFLVDEAILPEHEGRAEGLLSASSWAPGLSTAVNQDFVTAFTAATGTAPDAFALLGYEAGLLLGADLQAVDGPRGWIRPGPLGATRSSLHLRQVIGLTNQVVGALPTPAENDLAVAELRSAVRTGWINPYLV